MPFSFEIWKTFCYPKYVARSSAEARMHVLVHIIFLKLISFQLKHFFSLCC